ncbi:Rab guanyl-nucleotide exchange factor [Aureococcus anophagefferens]|nr:Rab guanyl-nucleotide exchange factor [Aureococcus anophagefferens]
MASENRKTREDPARRLAVRRCGDGERPVVRVIIVAAGDVAAARDAGYDVGGDALPDGSRVARIFESQAWHVFCQRRAVDGADYGALATFDALCGGATALVDDRRGAPPVAPSPKKHRAFAAVDAAALDAALAPDVARRDDDDDEDLLAHAGLPHGRGGSFLGAWLLAAAAFPDFRATLAVAAFGLATTCALDDGALRAAFVALARSGADVAGAAAALTEDRTGQMAFDGVDVDADADGGAVYRLPARSADASWDLASDEGSAPCLGGATWYGAGAVVAAAWPRADGGGDARTWSPATLRVAILRAGCKDYDVASWTLLGEADARRGLEEALLARRKIGGLPADDPSLFWSLAYHCARRHLPLCVPTSLVDVVVAGPSEAAAVALARRAAARRPTVDGAVAARRTPTTASELSVGRFDDLLVSRLEADSDAASSSSRDGGSAPRRFSGRRPGASRRFGHGSGAADAPAVAFVVGGGPSSGAGSR